MTGCRTRFKTGHGMPFEKNTDMERDIKSSDKYKPAVDDTNVTKGETTVIPVIEEVLKVDKKLVETGRIHIKKHIEEEEQHIEIPLVDESYQVKKIQVKNQIYDRPPSIRNEGDVTIIPVIKEIAEIKIRYEVTEEIHVIKNKTESTYSENVNLKKEKVVVERVSTKK
jgi:uncharacterized protein (TIGR02271 family)